MPKGFAILPGFRLPNGAILVEAKEHAFGDYVVLASWRDEYVTWHSDENGVTYWGHYFSNVADAVADYQTR